MSFFWKQVAFKFNLVTLSRGDNTACVHLSINFLVMPSCMCIISCMCADFAHNPFV